MAANSRRQAAVEIPECPVCLEQMTAPIFLCQSGHSICAGCTRVLSPPTCPVCRQPMTKMRNMTLEDIINEAKMPCPNSDAGCTFKLAGANVADHLRQCIFRQLDCPLVSLGRCSWTGQIKQMAGHFKEKHPAEFSGAAEAELEVTNMSLKECDRRMYLATLHRLLFIVTLKVDSIQGMAYWTCQLIGPKILAHQHIYEIHVMSKRNPHRKVVFTEHCMSDELKSDDIIRRSNCAIMSIDTLGNFTLDNKLSFKYCIKKIMGDSSSKQEEQSEVPTDSRNHGPRSTSVPRRGRGGGPRGAGPKNFQKGQGKPGSGQQESGQKFKQNMHKNAVHN